MNPIEQILLNFAKGEMTKNPQLAGSFLQHLMNQVESDPTLATDAFKLAKDLLPIILQAIK